jgi:hypothetical protein
VKPSHRICNEGGGGGAFSRQEQNQKHPHSRLSERGGGVAFSCREQNQKSPPPCEQRLAVVGLLSMQAREGVVMTNTRLSHWGDVQRLTPDESPLVLVFGVREGVAVAIVMWNKKRNPPLTFRAREG